MMLSVSWFSSYWLITRQLCYTVNICNQRPQHISLWNAFKHRQKAHDLGLLSYVKKPQRYLFFLQPILWLRLCLRMSVYQFLFLFFLHVLLFHIGHRNSPSQGKSPASSLGSKKIVLKKMPGITIKEASSEQKWLSMRKLKQGAVTDKYWICILM